MRSSDGIKRHFIENKLQNEFIKTKNTFLCKQVQLFQPIGEEDQRQEGLVGKGSKPVVGQ